MICYGVHQLRVHHLVKEQTPYELYLLIDFDADSYPDRLYRLLSLGFLVHLCPAGRCGPGSLLSSLGPFRKSSTPFPLNPGGPLKSIENASANCLSATDMNPVSNAVANNTVIIDFLYEFIYFIYLLQFEYICGSCQKL